MRNRIYHTITISILTAVLTVSALAIPASAASGTATQKSGWKSKVMLPSAGISYALSAKKTSLRDVENKLVRTGKMDKIQAATVVQADAAGTGTGTGQAGAVLQTDAADQPAENTAEVAGTTTVASTSDSAVALAAEAAYQDEVNAIVETTLTPVQEKEKAVIQRAQLQKQADVVNTEEISESEAIAASVAAPTVTEADLNKPIVRSGEETESQTEAILGSVAPEAAEDSAEETIDETGNEAEQTDADASSADPESAEETGEDDNDSNLVVSNVTTNDYINIRKEPNTDAEIVGKLYSGSVGTTLEETDDGWVKIQSGSVTGYVKKDYVATGATAQQMADEVRQDQAVVTTTTLRVRAAATVDSDVISLIGQGQKLDIIAEEGNFYKVSTDDGDGYISKDFADVETIYPDAVSIAEEEAAEKAKQQSSGGSGSSGGSSGTQSASGSSKGQQVVNYAMQFIGNPYVWGGSSLTNGTDCSGFTMAVYAHFGVSLPHYDASQRSCGTAIGSLSEAQPGDLICYYGHVGIYIGNGQIVHASNPATGITTGSATYRQIAAIRRIFN